MGNHVTYRVRFLKSLNLVIFKSTSSRFKNPPCGLLIEHSWPLGEVPLEVTIGENPYTRTLNFVIVRFDSPHNLLLGRTAMQKMGIVVSIIHATIKFHTPYRIDTVPSSYESNKIKEGEKKIKETILEAKKDVLICVDAEEKVIVNDKYPEQTTYADITNEYKHIKPVKQKKRGLGPDCNEAACKEVYELTKARILQKVKDQTWVANPFMAPESIDMMLNPKKCSLGVEKAVLRYICITNKGIRDNPSKVKAITDLEPPSTLKDVQSLNGKLVALR
ncbi:hypothetical protein Tco_0044367 [Tanacetum coccineum]